MNIRFKDALDYLVNGINKSQDAHHKDVLSTLNNLQNEIEGLRRDIKDKHRSAEPQKET